MHTLDYLIAKMSDPGNDFPVDFKPVLKVDQFKSIFNRTSAKTCKMLIENNFNVQYDASVGIVMKTLKQTAYYVLDEPVVLELYRLAKSNLLKYCKEGQTISQLKQQTLVYLYMCRLLESGSETQFKIDLLNLMLSQIQQEDAKMDAKEDV